MVNRIMGQVVLKSAFINKKIAFGDNLKSLPLKGIGRTTLLGKVRFSVVRKVLYPERIDLPTHYKEGSYTFLHHEKDYTDFSDKNLICVI